MSADPIGVLRRDPTGVRRTFGHRANTKAWPPAATATGNAAATMREASADYYSWFETPPPCEGRRHIQAVHRPEPAASEPAASRPVSVSRAQPRGRVRTCKCLRSHLLPTSITTIDGSACVRSSLSHLSTFSNVSRFEMSYTRSAPTAPR